MEQKADCLSAKWTRSLQDIPPFTRELLERHLIGETSQKSPKAKQPNAHKHKKYGYQLFKDKISKVKVIPNVLHLGGMLFYLKCTVHASMKKIEYSVNVHLKQDTGEVIEARCTCVAGNGGCCKHVAAALFQMLDFIELELTEVPDDLTCTQLLQEWHVPSCENIKTAILFDSVKFSKATSTKSSSHLIEISNPAPAFAQTVTESDIQKLNKELKIHCNTNQLNAVEVRDAILNQVTTDQTNLNKHIPSPEYNEFVFETLYKSKEQIQNIECNTRGQSDDELWYQERRIRLTASNFGSVLKRRESIHPKTILNKQFNSNCTKSVPKACLWGQNKEEIAIKEYIEKCNQNNNLIKACVSCGFIVNGQVPWLGASPDCLLYDPTECTNYGIGEVKCPFSKKEMTIDSACDDPTFFLEHKSKPTLKRNHNYFYQIQGLMATCNVEWADLIVYTENDLFSERIYFDTELWNKTMLPKLTSFYFTYIYPKLVNK
ncbi:uncharacterized protein LOC114540378 [Dendronephthya gigantea]|uniref:uncharacterized protein LOC114540378 n=1 Tax=Dendronephthya gigantea TaxID=151771 RepID=UPI001069561D|nr:uncharacterized protein LOC114540378 [Dendronephthya gigantea]